jgi:hypothetical protein
MSRNKRQRKKYFSWYFILLNNFELLSREHTRSRSWLTQCPTSWKVAGSIPDVIGIFH